jgi:hypothetical protein
MVKLPEPPDPAWLCANIAAELQQVPARTRLWRIYFRAGNHPTLWNSFRYWGPTGARFDHHLPDAEGQGCLQARGVLYAAGGQRGGLTCLAEVFQRSRLINPIRNEPWIVAFATAHDLTLLDLTGLWPTRAGASTALASGPRPRARAWSRAIYAAYPEIDGLLYPSSMAGHAPAILLYERAATSIPPRPELHRALSDPALATVLTNAARDLNYRLL